MSENPPGGSEEWIKDKKPIIEAENNVTNSMPPLNIKNE